MMTWNDGYVTDVEYTHGYYRELSPVHLDFCLLLQGFSRPKKRPLRYLELGFGHGLSLNIHAATCSGEFWGTDFLPQQANNAMSLAEKSGADLRILNESFAELETRTDLPEFDIIGLHGIWSWISLEARESIVATIRRHLAVGGVVYVSYNAQPGWSPAMPMRHLMALYAQTRKSDPIRTRIAGSIQLLEKLSGANGKYFAAVPSVIERVKRLKTLDSRYVAHEYFNQNWHCSHFSEIAETMSECRLEFAGSAHVLDQLAGIQLTPEGQQLLANETDVVMRETMRDYLMNQQFRRDIYVKGTRRLKASEHKHALAGAHFALIATKEDVKYEIVSAQGKVQLKKEVYEPIVEIFATVGKPSLTLEEVCRHPHASAFTAETVFEAIQVLVGGGFLCSAQDEMVAETNRQKAKALNAALIGAAEHSDDSQFMASAEVGGGIAVPRIHRLLMAARIEGAQSDADLIRATVPRLRPPSLLMPAVATQSDNTDLDKALTNDIANFRGREGLYRQLGLF